MFVLQPHGTILDVPVPIKIPFKMASGGKEFKMGKTASADSIIWEVMAVNVTGVCDVNHHFKNSDCDCSVNSAACNDWHFAETEINSFSVVAVF